MAKHVDRASAGSRSMRPVELGAGPEVVAGSEGALDYERSGRGRPEFRAPPFEKGRAERDVLLLFAWADLEYEEIARALGLPIGTVRSRLHRARQAMKEGLPWTS